MKLISDQSKNLYLQEAFRIAEAGDTEERTSLASPNVGQ